MIPPLPPREASDHPLVEFTRPAIQAGTSPRLVAMLRRNASVDVIRNELFPDWTYGYVRTAIVRCAASDEFTDALCAALPTVLHATAQTILALWRDQDNRTSSRDRCRTLRRFILDLDRLAETVRTMRPAQDGASHNDQREVMTCS